MYTRIRKFRITTRDGKTVLEETIDTKTISMGDLDSLIELFRIISSESRYRIMRFLSEREASSFKEICEALGYSQKTIAQSLDDLVRIHAVRRSPEGYMLSTVGKLLISQLKELAAILRKIREFEDLVMEFE
ncbi:MAG: hypothetical protein DRO36_05395 [Candidatus Hecatellales archaeon]|nr:MAG: hypothetical protein DRO36_05395 [Candidatus Hecatellales archaeon]